MDIHVGFESWILGLRGIARRYLFGSLFVRPAVWVVAMASWGGFVSRIEHVCIYIITLNTQSSPTEQTR